MITLLHLSGQLNGNLTLIFMTRCKYYKKIIICRNISLAMALWADIFIAYIALNPISAFFCQFYTGGIAHFAGSTIIFFFIAALITQWFSLFVAVPRWTWLLLLQRYFFTSNCTWWYLLSSFSFPPTFSALFFSNKFVSVSFI